MQLESKESSIYFTQLAQLLYSSVSLLPFKQFFFHYLQKCHGSNSGSTDRTVHM